MNNGFWWADGWDDPERLSPSEGCDLGHFVSASRSLRDALNKKKLKVDNNADIHRLALSMGQIEMPWRQYVDPAASRSDGKSSGTAIVLWECSDHVLTCMKRRGKWTLIEGDQTEGMIDVIDSSVTAQRHQEDLDITSSESTQEDSEVIFIDDEVDHSEYNKETPDFHEIEELSHNPDDDLDEEDKDLRIRKGISSQEADQETVSTNAPSNDAGKVKDLLEEIEELREELLHSELSFEQDQSSLIGQLKIALDVKDSYAEQIADLREKLHQSRELESELRYQLSRYQNMRQVDIEDKDEKSEESLPLLRQINLELQSELESVKKDLRDFEVESKMKQMQGLQREKDLLSRVKNAEREYKNLQSEMRKDLRENQLVLDRLKTEIQHLNSETARGRELLITKTTTSKPSQKKSRKRFFPFTKTSKPKPKKTKEGSAKKR